jgi:hypothetical protein
MPLGLPNHLAPRNVARAYSSSSHAIALYCLIAAFLAMVAAQASFVELVLWPCLIALLPMVAALYFVHRHRTTLVAAAYLLIGGACLYWYAAVGSLEFAAMRQTDSFLLTLPKLALIFVGAGSGVVSQIAWLFSGLVVGELAVVLAASQTGGVWSFDVGASGTAVSLAVIWGVIAMARSRSARTQPTFTRAVRDEQLSAVRYRIEVKAAAIMHDTVLNHLAAIAASPPGPLPPVLRAQVTRDLEVLLGEEWLLDADLPDTGAGQSWRSSGLHAAIEEARQLGLEVDVSGDVSAVSRLDGSRAQAVGLAAKQCLVNVIRHAGVSSAEVVIYGSDTDVSVMIVDAGKGFSVAETGADRLGLRQSVRHRIEAVDGDVQVWSTPGRGTSVMIRVPALLPDVAAADDADDEEGAA